MDFMTDLQNISESTPKMSLKSYIMEKRVTNIFLTVNKLQQKAFPNL
jgi:hypothetical protein